MWSRWGRFFSKRAAQVAAERDGTAERPSVRTRVEVRRSVIVETEEEVARSFVIPFIWPFGI